MEEDLYAEPQYVYLMLFWKLALPQIYLAMLLSPVPYESCSPLPISSSTIKVYQKTCCLSVANELRYDCEYFNPVKVSFILSIPLARPYLHRPSNGFACIQNGY